MTNRLRALALTALLGGLFSFSGCVVDDLTDGQNEPVPCTVSALCRLQNPADTILLTPDEKAEILNWFETTDDSTIFALSPIHIDSLAADTVRIKLLSDLHVTIDSVLFMVTDTLFSDSVPVIDWRGSVAAPHQGFVDLTFRDNEYQSGFAVINGKYITLAPLGPSKMLVVYQPTMIWMGECPPFDSVSAKVSGVQLTCVPVLP